MRLGLLSAIRRVQAIAGGSPGCRRRRSGGRSPRFLGRRRCQLESLEQRVLLSIVGASEEPSQPPWAPVVDAAWFDELAPASKNIIGPAPLQIESQPALPASMPQDEPGGGTPNRWVVQLTAEGTDLAGSVAGAADLLETALFETQVTRGLGLRGMVLVETAPGADPAAVETWLSSNPVVAYWESDSVLSTRAFPDDGDFDSLWGLHNTGQTGGTPDADIDAPEAWELGTGSASIVVGVIDTGVDYTHPDLAANVWTNPGEVPGNGIDDDRNGFVDDVHGYDFANGDGNPLDDNGHGTHVSGIIAGVGNNGQGVTGVNWTGSIMALKFLDDQGNGFTSAAVQALNYATLMRTTYGVDVRVTNNSWGGGGFSQALYDAIQASGDAGMLFVAAGGNDGLNTDEIPHYPSSYDLPNIISVAATDHQDGLSSFSNYGPTSVDLAAPGVGIYSTLPGGGYGSYSGSSMAAPHVAGVAALAWSVDLNATVERVRGAILDGVDPLGSLAGKVAAEGRLNAHRTLEGLSLSVSASDPAHESILSTPPVDFTISFTHPYDPLTLDAADLAVNGTSADQVTVVDGQTATFHFDTTPVAGQGPQPMEIGEGTILRAADGDPIRAWQATFYYDALPLTVLGTLPYEGQVLAAPPAQLVLDFNEPVDPESLDLGDLLLNVGSVTAAAMLDADTAAYSLSGLPREGQVTYTLSHGAIRDAYGTPASAYAGGFTIDDPKIERYGSGDVPKSITDYATVRSTLTIDQTYAIGDLDVEIELAHTYDADLDAFLIAPDGTRVELFTGVGGSGDDFSGTILDDEAPAPIAHGQAPFRGRYQPEQPLSAIDGLDAMGTWILEIGDHGARDQGVLHGWALVLERGHELAPRIRSVDPLPPDGQEAWGIVESLDVHFSKPMNPAGVNDANSWELIEAGPDGLFDTVDDADYPLTVSPPYLDGLTATLDTGLAQLPAGSYRLRGASAGLADLSGTALDGDGDGVAGGDYVTHFVLLPNDWYPSHDVPKAIADFQTITSTLSIAESFPIADLDVRIDVAHTFDADLDAYLITPGGTRIELFTDVGGNGQDFSGTILDDEADTAITDGEAPFSGRYRPQQPLSVVDGSNAKGTWTLEISDDGRLDQGTLNDWALIVERGTQIPPQITHVDPLPPDGGETWGPLDRFEVHFSEAMGAASVNDPNHWELREAGADRRFDTPDDSHHALTVTPPYENGLVATLRPSAGRLPAGAYRLRAVSGGLADVFGSPLDGDADGTGGDHYVAHFTMLPSDRYPSPDVPKDVIDFITATSTLTIDQSLTVADVDVQLFVSHTYDSDLDVYLIAPDGTRIELFTDAGGSGNDFSGTILDDEATTSLAQGAAPFVGRFRPEGLLSVVDGSDAKGTWTLEITDDAQWDGGTLEGWALLIEPEAGLPPRIEGHAPDGATLGPVSSLRIDFDRPMDEGSFAPNDDIVSFVGPQGPLLTTGYRWPGPDTLEILFDPQSAPGAYTMVLGPQILDAAGVALDGDGDLLPGEAPDDRYPATFVVAQPLGTVAFVELDGLDPSQGALWYQFQTTRPGVLTLQANFQVGLGNVELALYDQIGNDPPVAVSTPTYGNRRIDLQVAAPGGVYYLKLSGSNAAVSLRLANLLRRDGETVTVFGTDGDDRFEFETAVARQVTVNGLRYEFDITEVSSIAFEGGAGDDAATFHGTDEVETVQLWPDHGVVTGSDYTATITGAEFVTVHGGANDIADLYDSEAADTLIATPEFAALSGPGYAHRVELFGHVHAHATPGASDVALLHDDDGRTDTFIGTPGEAVLYGDAFYNSAESFRYVHAYSTQGGADVALLYDDPAGQDSFQAWPQVARLFGPGFYNRVNSFRYVHAYATEGNGDVALLHDDPEGQDTFQAWPDMARMFGAAFYNRVNSFDYVHAYGSPNSKDVAMLYDSAGRDFFQAWPQMARLYGAGFHNRVNSFRYVHAYATEGNGDVALLYDDPEGQDTFQAWPDVARMFGARFYNRVNSFDYVHAYGSPNSKDVAMLYDSAGRDSFEAWPDMARMFGTGFYNRVNSFRYVHGYATPGGDDVAKLYDSPGKDTFQAWPDAATLFGTGFYNRVKSFAYVEAWATAGGDDRAELFDSAMDDLLEADGDWARLSNTDLGFANLAVAFELVEATSSNEGDTTDIGPTVDFLVTYGPW